MTYIKTLAEREREVRESGDHFKVVRPMDWRHWGMIALGFAFGGYFSYATDLPYWAQIFGWFIGILLVYYSPSWPATAKLLTQHMTAGIYTTVAVIGLSFLPLTEGFQGTKQQWNVLLTALLGRFAAISFVAAAGSILKSATKLKVGALKHGVLLYEGHNKGLLVKEGDPIFARSGWQIEEQDNQKNQDPDKVSVEVGGTVPVNVDFFTETEIAINRWDENGQIFWQHGEPTARHGFRNAVKVKARKLAAEAFEPGAVGEFKRVADGPFTLWMQWLLMTDEDPREDPDIIRATRWAGPLSRGHVPMLSGIKFFEENEEFLTKELELRAKKDSKIEEEFGRNFVGEGFGITDVRGPKGLEDAYGEGAEIKALEKTLKEVPDGRLQLLLAARGRIGMSVEKRDEKIDVTGLGENAIFIAGGSKGPEAILARQGGKGDKNKGNKGHGGGH